MVRTLKVSQSTHTLRQNAEAQSGKASEGYSDPTASTAPRQLSNLTIQATSNIESGTSKTRPVWTSKLQYAIAGRAL